MATLTKSSKTGCKPVTRRTTAKTKLPSFMEISSVTGLPVAKARPGVKPATTAAIKAMLADFP